MPQGIQGVTATPSPAPPGPRDTYKGWECRKARSSSARISPQIGQHPSHSPQLGKTPKHGQAPQPLTLMFPLASRRMFSSFRSLCTIPFCKGRQSRAQLRVLEEGKGWGGHCRSPTGVDPSQGGEISGNNPRFAVEDELEATSRPGCYQQGFSHMPAPRTRLLHPLGPTPQGEPSSGLCWDLPKQHPEVLRAQEAPRSLLSLPRAGRIPGLRMSHVRGSWGPCRAGRAHPQPHSPLPGNEVVTQGCARSPRTQPWAGQGLVPPAGLVSPTAQQPLGEAEPSQNAAGALPKGPHTLQIRGRVNPTSQERRVSCSHLPAPRGASLPRLQHLLRSGAEPRGAALPR